MVDDAIIGQRSEPIAEPCTHVLGPLDQTLALHDRQVGQPSRARRWVAGVREAVAKEEVGVTLERSPGRGPDEHAAQRLIARRDRLGKSDQIGANAVVMSGEPRAQAAVAGDDLVEDQICAVLVAQAAHLLQVLLAWRIDAAGALHRLGQDCGNGVAVLGHQAGQRLDIVGRHLHHVGHVRTEVLLVGGDALGAGAAVGHAVIPAHPRDDQLALRLTCLHMSDTSQLHGRIDRL